MGTNPKRCWELAQHRGAVKARWLGAGCCKHHQIKNEIAYLLAF